MADADDLLPYAEMIAAAEQRDPAIERYYRFDGTAVSNMGAYVREQLRQIHSGRPKWARTEPMDELDLCQRAWEGRTCESEPP